MKNAPSLTRTIDKKIVYVIHCNRDELLIPRRHSHVQRHLSTVGIPSYGFRRLFSLFRRVSVLYRSTNASPRLTRR